MQRSSLSSQRRPAREPVHRPLVWVLIVLAIAAGVPWYLPAGLIDPVIGHLPGWFWISMASAVVLSAVTCWACLTQWRLEDSDEEGERS